MGVIAHRGPGSGGQGAVSLAILETLPPHTILVFGSRGLLGEGRVWSPCYTRESETAQGLNPCLLHWQVDSLPLSRQGSPVTPEASHLEQLTGSSRPLGW